MMFEAKNDGTSHRSLIKPLFSIIIKHTLASLLHEIELSSAAAGARVVWSEERAKLVEAIARQYQAAKRLLQRGYRKEFGQIMNMGV